MDFSRAVILKRQVSASRRVLRRGSKRSGWSFCGARAWATANSFPHPELATRTSTTRVNGGGGNTAPDGGAGAIHGGISGGGRTAATMTSTTPAPPNSIWMARVSPPRATAAAATSSVAVAVALSTASSPQGECQAASREGQSLESNLIHNVADPSAR